ncbi:putative secreted protein (Por secretion system target) [Marinilabilia salmonicolor]|uniref:Putative secreted protein (Por secretion system target) n=2 Tax=Marinilabilia salmonicolor TaxID=989 RepID=A0A368UV36_9BACT|nr:putative secreted protein (Por secretion system target) [Marinilabilia salmonicolor]
MKKLYLLLLIVISVSSTGFCQFTAIDTTMVSSEVLLKAQVKKMTRELELTKDQQKEIYKFLKTKTAKRSSFNLSDNPTDLLQLLTFQQKATFLRLLDIDKKASGVKETQNLLKSGTQMLSSGTMVTLDDAVHIKDSRIVKNTHPNGSYSEDTNYSYFERFCLQAWTYSGSPMYKRTVMKFILDEIPVGSQIISANLFLYSDPTITSPSSSDGNSQLSGSNAFYIEQITEPWNDLTVTWNNQPASTTDNRILFPASTSPTENIQIDMTGIVQTWVNSPDINHGIKMFLQTEVKYRARNYGSMEHENTSIRPKLVIEYSNPESTIEYFYDNAGNRTNRQVVVINNPLKSASKNEEIANSQPEPVKSLWNDIEINIFPNPTAGDVNISFDGFSDIKDIQYSIFNAMGKMVAKGQINSLDSDKLPFSNLPRGVYILILKSNDDSKQWKIIKQ